MSQTNQHILFQTIFIETSIKSLSWIPAILLVSFHLFPCQPLPSASCISTDTCFRFSAGSWISHVRRTLCHLSLFLSRQHLSIKGLCNQTCSRSFFSTRRCLPCSIQSQSQSDKSSCLTIRRSNEFWTWQKFQRGLVKILHSLKQCHFLPLHLKEAGKRCV